MIYLAVPIKHEDPAVELQRIRVANRVAAQLHDEGVPVFSPASHGGHFAPLGVKRRGWDYWSEIDLPILTTCCSELMVIMMPGWDESVGVTAEIEAAKDIGIPINFVNPPEIGNA